MSMTNYPQGLSSFGIPVMGPLLTTGRVIWVSSVTGSNSVARGLLSDPDKPIASVAYAFSSGLVRANKGDIILIMPNHDEAIIAAGTITANIAGVRVIGLGQGADRPSFNFGTATTATIAISANGVSFENCIFDYTGIDAIATGINVTGADVTIRNCRLGMSDGTNQAAQAVTLAAGADRFQFLNNQVEAANAGAVACIGSAVAADMVRIEGNYFSGNFSTAAINNAAVAWTRLFIKNNDFYILGTGKAIVLVATSTGIIAYNNFQITANIAAGGSITAAAALKVQNFAQETAGIASSAVLDPTSAAIS